MPEARILIVEDEPAMAEGIRFNLRHEGFEVECVGSAEAADPKLAPGAPFDLVLLDVMLPGEDGFSLLERLRARGAALPIVLLTARGGDVDVIRGLELGADDYVAKPFSLGQLVARIRAVLRRARGPAATASSTKGPAPLVCGDVAIDLERGTVTRRGRTADLTVTEAEILRVVAAAPGRTASRDEILAKIWGHGCYPSTRTVDNHVARLRKKLEDDPAVPRVLVTVHGRGYRLVVP
jgi:DNA-binding response OmpR family regulator